MAPVPSPHAAPPPHPRPRLRLGTRQSPLAMAQAEETRRRLCAAHGWAADAVELVPVVASGDKVLDRPLAEIGGKALWTKELDQWLSEGRIDAAVHSAKDVETDRPAAFHFPAFLPRADRRDCLVGATSIAAIPPGAVVGTSAPRRAAQLLNLRPDCRVVMFRGNVATRLAKLEAGEADVTFLAAAGLERLGAAGVGHPLDPGDWLPAAAQGVIAIECLADNAEATALLAAIDHAPTRTEILAERALLAALGGSCQSPVAVVCDAVVRDEGVLVRVAAALFSPDGRERVEARAQFAAGDEAAVAALAADLLARATPGIAPHFKGLR